MSESAGVIVRRWVKFLKRYSYGTGRGGCHRWSFDSSEACAFADEAAAREWLAGTPAEVVPGHLAHALAVSSMAS